MKKKKKLIIIILAIVLIIALASGVLCYFLLRVPVPDGPTEPTETTGPTEPTQVEVTAPAVYQIDEVSIQAFPVGPNIKVTLQQPPEETEPEETEPVETTETTESTEETTEPTEVTEAATDPNAPPPPGVHLKAIYSYLELSEASERVADYCKMLMREDFGFVPLDNGNMEIELPVIETTGSIRLGQDQVVGEPPAQEHWIFSIQMDWTADGLSVTLAKADGLIQKPVEPKPEKLEPITLMEAQQIFQNCKPSDLNLQGSSMSEYDIIMVDGTVMVGEEPFMRVNIYQKGTDVETNEISGMYLLSPTGKRMYQVDLNNCIYPINFQEDS